MTLVGASPVMQRGGAVPEADDTVGVDEEDAVADRLEDAARPAPARRRRRRRRLGRLEPPALGVEARVADGGGHLRDEALDELELLLA